MKKQREEIKKALEAIRDFQLHEGEAKKREEFIAEHDKTCARLPHAYQGAIPISRFSYTFQPNSIGTSIYMRCSCGEGVDLTDSTVW